MLTAQKWMIYWNGLYTNKRINHNVQFFFIKLYYANTYACVLVSSYGNKHKLVQKVAKKNILLMSFEYSAK